MVHDSSSFMRVDLFVGVDADDEVDGREGVFGLAELESVAARLLA